MENSKNGFIEIKNGDQQVLISKSSILGYQKFEKENDDVISRIEVFVGQSIIIDRMSCDQFSKLLNN